MLVKPLHPYQDPGVDAFLERGNLLMAAGTGTGKTVMGIAMAEELLGCEDINLCLIVCPASLKYQWAQKISEFTDVLSFRMRIKDEWFTVPRRPYGIIIEGKAYQKDRIKHTAAEDRHQQYRLISDQTDYVIISYENLLDDSRFIRHIKPDMVILDEASAIKTFKAQRTKQIKKLLAVPYRLALTATPIENAPEELFSIMQWVDEEVLGRWDLFEKSYIVRDGNGQVVRYKNLDILHQRVSQAMWRKSRNDPDVAPYLPDDEEDTWPVELDERSRHVYLKMSDDLLQELYALPKRGGFDVAAHYGGYADESTAVGKVMSKHQCIERFLDHPKLVNLSAEDYLESERQRQAGRERRQWPGSKYAFEVAASGLLDEELPAAKMDVLKSKVDAILAEDSKNKILIFTKYRQLLPLIQAHLHVKCVTYDGTMNARNKAAAVARFTEDPRTRVFLSSHAGAYGCDMWMANHLINVDQPPSAGRQDQINGRHIRASGEFDLVYIHNLVVVGTIEERNVARLEFKGRIGSAIIDGKGHVTEVGNDVTSLTSHLEAELERYA